MYFFTSTTPVMETMPSGAPKEFGEAFTHDPEFRGPVKDRSCTDVICLFLLLSFIAGWAVIAGFAFTQGDPSVLIYPTDSEGNICGIGKRENQPYLFFFDLTKCARPTVAFTGCQTPQVCVQLCPNKTFAAFGGPHVVKSDLICKYRADVEKKSIPELIRDNDCAAIYFKSVPLRSPSVLDDMPYGSKLKDIFVGRCIPEHLVIGTDSEILDYKNKSLEIDGKIISMKTVKESTKFLAMFLDAKQLVERVFSDVKISWHLILIGLIFSMLISFVWIILMRWIAGIMVWLSIFLVLAFSTAACVYSGFKYHTIQEQASSVEGRIFQTHLESYFALKNTWLAFAIISGIILIILLLVLIFLRSRLRISIALIKQGSRAVGSITTSLIFPLVPYGFQLIVFIYWISLSIYLAASGKASFRVANAPTGSNLKNDSRCDPEKWSSDDGLCLFQAYGDDQNLHYAQIYNLFGLFWCLFFSIGMGQLALAGAFSSYYWSLEKPKDIPHFAMGLGIWRAVRYHMGSVAFGSLLIAIVRMIRVALEYIQAKLKKYPTNKIANAILCLLRCCFWCLENCLKFISKNAYIMIAVYGKNFCYSARQSFMLLMRNVVRAVVLDKVTDFLLLFGKLVVVGFTAFLSFAIFTGKMKYLNHYIPTLNYNVLPVMIITLGSYLIASGFFSVYSMAVDTLFLCFLEDCERNDGSPEKPYYMSKELMQILGKRNVRDPDK